MGDQSTIRREGDTVIVEVKNKAHLLSDPMITGVVCINPDASEAKRVYRKVFRRKPVYLAKEYERAVEAHLRGTDVVVIGMNGYSYLPEDTCRKWGVQFGAYEAACKSILFHIAETLQAEYPGIDIRFAHGASAMGVDLAVVSVARRLNRPQLGFNCPSFMFYVEDDDVPVYIADNKNEYADAFVRSLNILIAANGRTHSYQMDIAAVFKHYIYLIPINVMRLISTNSSGPPAIMDGNVEDAVALFEERVFTIGTRVLTSRTRDAWRAAIEEVQDVTTMISRQLLSAERAFGGATLTVRRGR